MKVYTHYNKIANTDMGYRWRTLLQFGNSWDVIGSIVIPNRLLGWLFSWLFS